MFQVIEFLVKFEVAVAGFPCGGSVLFEKLEGETTINFFTGATEAFPSSLMPGEYKVYVNR